MHPFIHGAFEAASFFNYHPLSRGISEERIEIEKSMPSSLLERISFEAGGISANLAEACAITYCSCAALEQNYVPLIIYGSAKLATNAAALGIKKVIECMEHFAY